MQDKTTTVSTCPDVPQFDLIERATLAWLDSLSPFHHDKLPFVFQHISHSHLVAIYLCKAPSSMIDDGWECLGG